MNDRPTTRLRIITEATRLFAAQGIKATTVAQIEQAVGLRKGSGGVHRHFATKDELVSAVLETQLAGGASTLKGAKAQLPIPTPEAVAPYLRTLGHFVLTEAEKNRDVALIMLRDGHALGDQVDAHRRRNDDLAYGATAETVRAVQNQLHETLGLDADAYGYVFLAPLIYFKLIEWVTGHHPLDIDDEALVETWATVVAPSFREIAEATRRTREPATGKGPSKRTARAPRLSRRG